MKVLDSILTTTHVDSQGESPSKSALEGMAHVLNSTYLSLHMHHDPRIPPVGRVLRAEVRPLEDGEYALWGQIEIWEAGDTRDSLEGDGRRATARTPKKRGVFLDFALLDPDRVSALQQALEGIGVVEYRAKKSAELAAGAVIVLGVYAIGKLSSGFLEAAGKDLYTRAKPHLFPKDSPAGGLDALEIAFVVSAGDREVDVVCFLPDPTPAEVESFLSDGRGQLPSLVKDLLQREPRAARLFIQWDASNWRLHYWVRDDGVPSRIEPVAVESLSTMGLSMSGTVPIRIDSDPKSSASQGEQ